MNNEIKKDEETKKGVIVIPKKAMLGIAPAIAITAILLSKDQAPQLLLFIVGIGSGILIGKGFFEK